MKYLSVTISILAMWIATVFLIIKLDYKDILLPLIALGMTLILFIIGFRSKQ